MAKLKRGAITNKIYFMIFGIIAVIAWIDSKQIIAFHTLDSPEAWSLYNQIVLPAFIGLWLLIMVSIAIVYFMLTKDKSEAWGLFFVGAILLLAGVEDVMFFAFSEEKMPECMQWLDDLGAPVSIWSSKVIKEDCTSPGSLVSFAILGSVASYLVLQRQRKIKG